jgi:hypothetical protein
MEQATQTIDSDATAVKTLTRPLDTKSFMEVLPPNE